MLKSWAVTKGPSYFPGDKRLAVQVEDHPMEYGGFEGIIPQGQYGGGTVMLWDRGTWEPHGDAGEGLRNGSLKFALHGEKMHGNWALVRMHPRPGERADKPNWLLIKEHDEYERPQDAPPIEEEAPNSVLSGRVLDAIARDSDRVWQVEPRAGQRNSEGPRGSNAEAEPQKPKHRSRGIGAESCKAAPKEKLPKFIAPQLATLARSAPSGEEWLHEIKLDGYRIQARLERKRNQVRTADAQLPRLDASDEGRLTKCFAGAAGRKRADRRRSGGAGGEWRLQLR